MDEQTVDAGVETTDEGSVVEPGVEADASVSSAEGKGEPDWKEIAANYKQSLTQKRQLRKSGVIAPSTEEAEPEDDARPVTLKDLKDFQQQTVAQVAATKEDTLLTQKVSDPAKREYIKALLDTRIVRTGTSETDIAADIDAALAIADAGRIARTVSELKRAADNRPPAPSAGGSSEKPLEQKTYKWTPQEAQALEAKAKRIGVDPEKFKQQAWQNKQRTPTAG